MKLNLILLISSVWTLEYVQGRLINKHPGEIKTEIKNRIIDGETAELGQFPHQVLVRFENLPGGPRGLCGGSLISKDWVLTAAHCVNFAPTFRMRFGTIKQDGADDDSLQEVNSSRVIMHGQFDQLTLKNDIALIKLEHSVDLNDHVKTVELDSEGISDGENVTISGWGINANYIVTSTLNYANLVTISNEECARAHGESFVQDTTLCAKGDEIQSPCRGDGGGALVQRVDDKFVQVGIASFVSTERCNIGDPSGYARVSKFRPWIRNKTNV